MLGAVGIVFTIESLPNLTVHIPYKEYISEFGNRSSQTLSEHKNQLCYDTLTCMLLT